MAVAAAVVFYALLAVFPAITAFVSFYGLFTDPSTVTNHLGLVKGVIPYGAFSILEQQANRAASGGAMQLGVTSILALLFALWSANAGTEAIMDALNVVYGEHESRGFLRLNLVALLLTLGTMATLLVALVALGAVVVGPLLLAAFGAGSLGQLEVLRWPLMIALILGARAMLYRLGPSRRQTR